MFLSQPWISWDMNTSREAAGVHLQQAHHLGSTESSEDWQTVCEIGIWQAQMPAGGSQSSAVPVNISVKMLTVMGAP